jgi:Ca2+-binding EF-hand superfamily protein
MMPNAAGRPARKIGSRRTAIVSGALMVLALAFMVEAAGAAPRQGDEGQPIPAATPLVGLRVVVALPVRRAAIADPDLDGVVSRMEAARYYQSRFALIDRNRDGRVSREEFLRPAAAHARQVRGNAPARTGHDAAGTDGIGALTANQLLGTGDRRGAWLDAGVDRQPTAIFDLLDVGRDGTLSRQEFTDAGAEDFAASDADRDGQITIREFYAGKRL